MLDPLTAIGLASSVVQLADFGLKLVRGSIKIYYSADGLDVERSDLEAKASHIRKLANRVVLTPKSNDDNGPESEDAKELMQLAKSCDEIASDLLVVLGDFRVRKAAGPGKKWESFRKAVEIQTPYNKDRIASLEKRLNTVQQAMFNRINAMML